MLVELSKFFVTLPGDPSQKLVAGFVWILSHVPFLFVHFALCSLTVINISHEYNYLLNPLGFPRKSLNQQRLVLGTLNIATKELA